MSNSFKIILKALIWFWWIIKVNTKMPGRAQFLTKRLLKFEKFLRGNNRKFRNENNTTE